MKDLTIVGIRSAMGEILKAIERLRETQVSLKATYRLASIVRMAGFSSTPPITINLLAYELGKEGPKRGFILLREYRNGKHRYRIMVFKDPGKVLEESLVVELGGRLWLTSYRSPSEPP